MASTRKLLVGSLAAIAAAASAPRTVVKIDNRQGPKAVHKGKDRPWRRRDSAWYGLTGKQYRRAMKLLRKIEKGNR